MNCYEVEFFQQQLPQSSTERILAHSFADAEAQAKQSDPAIRDGWHGRFVTRVRCVANTEEARRSAWTVTPEERVGRA